MKKQGYWLVRVVAFVVVLIGAVAIGYNWGNSKNPVANEVTQQAIRTTWQQEVLVLKEGDVFYFDNPNFGRQVFSVVRETSGLTVTSTLPFYYYDNAVVKYTLDDPRCCLTGPGFMFGFQQMGDSFVIRSIYHQPLIRLEADRYLEVKEGDRFIKMEGMAPVREYWIEDGIAKTDANTTSWPDDLTIIKLEQGFLVISNDPIEPMN